MKSTLTLNGTLQLITIQLKLQKRILL